MDPQAPSIRSVHALCAWALVITGVFAEVGGGISAHAGEQGAVLPPIDVVAALEEFRQFEKVEVTGSSIVRKEQTQALPVQVITREDIRRSGLKTVAEVVQSLPTMGNFVESSQLLMIVGGYSNAAIHGMPNGTLVRVDGVRLAPFGRPTVAGPERSSVDLATLPLADVERIEVLTDGASSLYGTDAIAGVVNIILRKERKGMEISGDYIRPGGGAGQGWVSSIGWGTGQLQRDGYSFMVTAEFSKRQELLGRDRPYASAAQYEFESGGKRYAANGMLSGPFSSPATLSEAASGSYPGGRLANSLYQSGACAAGGSAVPGQKACYQNVYHSLGIYPQQESQRLHARGEMALGGGDTVFADLLLGHHVAVQSARWWDPVGSQPGLPAGSLADQQAAMAGLDPAQTSLQWMPDLPALRMASVQTNGRLLLGMRGEWQDWTYRSSAYFSQSDATFQSETFGDFPYSSLGIVGGGVWSNDNVMRPLDRDNPLTAQLEAWRGGLKTANAGVTRLYGLQANGSRAVAEIDGREVMLGLGVDFRMETSQFKNYMPRELQVDPPTFDARRQVSGVFGELQIPVTPTWEVNLGGRSDRYSDVGGTTNGKIFSRWTMTPEWSMRGSLGTGFRAPSVAQTQSLSNPFVWGFSASGLQCDAQQQAIASSLQGVCTPHPGSGQLTVLGNGNPDLKPEKSTQVTWGMAFMPHRNFRLAADLWAVRIRDMIQTMLDDLVLENPTRYAANYRLIPEGLSNAGELALYVPLQNLGASEKAGADLEADWRKAGEWGRWSLKGQATWLLRSRSRTADDAEYSSDLGRYDPAVGTVSPRLRLRVTTGLARGGWAGYLTLNHTSGYQDVPVKAVNLESGAPEIVTRRVDSFTTWDFQLHHAVNRQLDLRFGVFNLFNQQAPLSFATTSVSLSGANPVYSSLWGRTLNFGMTLRF